MPWVSASSSRTARFADPAIKHVLTEAGKAGATVNLYELEGANVGQLSPTKVMWATDYSAAVTALREHGEVERRVVVFGPPGRPSEFIYRVWG